MRPAVSFALLAAAAMLTSCTRRDISKVDPTPTREGYKLIEGVNRNVDLLFVIDDSLSMVDEQTSLRNDFPYFIQELQKIQGGLPDVHIGIITTDVTTKTSSPTSYAYCKGHNGMLQTGQPMLTCTSAHGMQAPYLEDRADPGDPSGATRIRNYTGQLEAAFSCIANVGTGECGFEQHLEAIRLALDGRNQGFLRPNAWLAVVIISDEDDCTASNLDLFDSAKDLGPMDNIRCMEQGVRCEPTEMRTPGPRTNCMPRTDSAYIHSIDRYVSFLKGLKSNPGNVLVAGILGPPTPVAIEIKANGNPEFVPSCTYGGQDQRAFPAIRLKAFLDQFPSRNVFHTICLNPPTKPNLRAAITDIGRFFAEKVSSPCIEGDIDLDGNPANGLQYHCLVTELLFDPQTPERVLPECATVGGQSDCWSFVPGDQFKPKPVVCTGPNNLTGLALQVNRAGTGPDPGANVTLRCVLN